MPKHIASWLEPAAGALVILVFTHIILGISYILKLSRRLDLLEVKVDQNRSEREMELRAIQDTLSTQSTMLQENQDRLQFIRENQVVVQTQLQAVIKWTERNNIICPLAGVKE